MANLNRDIVYNILCQLPSKSLFRFKCVCKDWNKLISSSEFIESHRKHSSSSSTNHFLVYVKDSSSLYQVHDLDTLSPITTLSAPPETSFRNVIGSCNGLICLETYGGGVSLCNPSIRLFKELPNPKEQTGIICTQFAFGYDCQDDDYKILGFCDREVLVYSSRAGVWKRLIERPKDINIHRLGQGEQVNNRLHWERNQEIISFDLHSESWDNRLPLPPMVGWVKGVGVFDGSLCLHTVINDPITRGHTITNIWVMKEYGVKESWTKLFEIPSSGGMPLAYCKEGGDEIFFRGCNGVGLYGYNKETQKATEKDKGVDKPELGKAKLCLERPLTPIPGSGKIQLLQEEQISVEEKKLQAGRKRKSTTTEQAERVKRSRVIYESVPLISRSLEQHFNSIIA